MDYRSLVNKLEAIEAGTYISEASAPSEFKPTHFHKGNLGNKLPVMQTPDGNFWWEGGNQNPESGPMGSTIVPWNGNTLNRSGWNPASIDGVITPDGKYIDFPEGVTWQDYKKQADDDAAILEKLKKLIELVDKYVALKAKRGGQGARPALTPKTQDMGDGSKLTVDPKTGNVAATNDDGTPYVPGSNPNLPKNKIGEGVISKGLMESFGYETKADEGVLGAGASMLGKAASKAAPGVGAVLGAQGAYDSYQKGDYLGAALNGLSGAFSLVPGLGWIPALGFGAWQAGRELSGATDKYDKPATPQQGAKPSAGSDPSVLALQQKLIKAGAKIQADGIMGPQTQAAMKQFPNIKEGTDMNQTKSLAESMKELQARLSMIESDTPAASEEPKPEPASGEENSLAKQLEQAGGKLMEKDGRQFMVIPDKGIAVEVPSMEIVDASTPALTPTGKQFDPTALGLSEDLDEGIWDSIAKAGANLAKGAKFGFANPTAAKNLTTASHSLATKGGRLAGRAGAAVARNPGKTALATGLAGLGGGYAAGKMGQGSTAPVTPTPGAGQGTRPTPAPTPNIAPEAPAGDDEEMKALRAQIDALIKDLSTSKNPEVIKGLAAAQEKLK